MLEKTLYYMYIFYNTPTYYSGTKPLIMLDELKTTSFVFAL